ncbi:hypothetical protein [Sphingobacterium thalpophilum]|uniref:hypothetical protein n=1 Tax=Sphingobacterium thalpophilum TaxID=259 RepID=UPI0031E2CA8F
MHVKQYIFVVILIGYHYISNAQVMSFNVDPQKIHRELASQLDSIFQEDQALPVPRHPACQSSHTKEILPFNTGSRKE